MITYNVVFCWGNIVILYDVLLFPLSNIEARPTGVSRGVKKLLKNKIPNLGTLDDISDFMTG